MNLPIVGMVSLVLFVGAEPIFAENYVGIILSGHEKECEILHHGEIFQCRDRRQLYVDDIVTRKPSIKLLKRPV